MTVQFQHRLFTVSDYHKMAKVGILREDDRVELIRGEILQMPPIGSTHAYVVGGLGDQLFGRLLAQGAIINVQNPIRIDATSEPQPDIAILKGPRALYKSRLPAPEDVLLLIEVADSSAEYDREVKLPLYAQAGIVEFWIVDIRAQAIEVFLGPSEGDYASKRVARRGETLEPSSLPGIGIAVDDILG